ncbi:hypothetical protein F5Y11DRAFT_319646 [Daldinia sp. FL1419]|nr:hypothetical protein F5Y11DRAFT_319646 [Daldinia sp. FL1419]
MAIMTRAPRWIPRRCGLCQCDFSLGAVLVPTYPDGELLQPFLYDQEFVSDSEFTRHVRRQYTFPDDCIVVVCDSECVRFLNFKPHNFWQIVAYTFEPSLSEKKRRFAWLHSHLASRITLPQPYLPTELRNEIARYLVREYSVTKAIKNWLTFQVPIDICIDISIRIWVRYVEFEGVKYIATLTNGPCTNGTLLITYSEVNDIYILEDHLGIRQIHFIFPAHIPLIPGTWWRTLSRSSNMQDTNLQGKTDGFKLRDLTWSNVNYTQRSRRLAWDILPLPASTIRYHGFGGMALRMASVPYNTLTVTGYSFCWNDQLRSIHAHTKGSSFYESTSRVGDVWLYMPIDPGEYIIEIWMRHRRLPREMALVLRTSTGRVMIAGPQKGRAWPACAWSLLDTPENLPNRMYFEHSPRGIHEFGFETPLPAPRESAFVPVPESPYPESTSVEDFFHTSASLDGVVAVTPCRVKQGDITNFTGMLLHYENGHKVAVGQIKFDCLDDTFRISPSETLLLGFSTTNGYPYVASIQLSPLRKDNMVYLNVPWYGQIEWWFSCRQCKIYCNGEASIPTIF